MSSTPALDAFRAQNAASGNPTPQQQADTLTAHAAQYREDARLYDLQQAVGLSGVRAPRYRALLDGGEIAGCIRLSVTQNAFYQADRFRGTFALRAPKGHDMAWWDRQKDAAFTAEIGYQNGTDISWKALVTGQIDQVHIDPLDGIVQVEGRDLASVFIEAKTQETFANQTSSQIVQTLAARHGMSADVDETTTEVSRYYQIDHTHESHGQFSRTTTEWDLMSYLAQREDFDLFVTGSSLHFKKKAPENVPPFRAVFALAANAPSVSNVMRPRFGRALTLAKDIEVVVQSWHAKKGLAFTKKARATGEKATGGSKLETKTQRVVIIRPNLTEAEAQQLANNELRRLSAHERTFTFVMPGELTLTPRVPVVVSGTASGWDQAYIIDTIEREVGFEDGFTQTVHCKNHSVTPQVALA